MFEFHTLGSIELQGEDGRSLASVIQHPKRLALLAYLCTSDPPRLHRRDTLLALLWPELDRTHARGALRQELHQLRRALGPGILRGDRADAVGVDSVRLVCDAQRFEAALNEDHPAEALALWKGEFLPGLHVDGGEFERWLDEARAQLAHRAVEAARRLMREAEQAGDEAAALTWARRLTELAPYDETGWRELILLLDHQGDRAGALRAYGNLTARFSSELEVDPAPETRLLIERIRGRGEVFDTDASGLARLSGAPTAHQPQGPVRPVIELRPVENLTGEASLDALARPASRTE